MASTQDDWFTCPVCGEVVDANALACPHCGADDETGWSDQAEYDELDLPTGSDGEDEVRLVRSRWVLTIGFALLLAFILFLTKSCLG